MSLMYDRARLSKLKSFTASSPPGASFFGSDDFPPALVDAVRATDPAGLLSPFGSKQSANAQAVNLTLTDYKPVRASQYVLTGSSMSATTATINGVTLTPALAAQGATAVPSATAQACTNNTFTVPPLSVSMVVFTLK